MSRYQFRRLSPIQVPATRSKRQEAGLGAVGPGSEGEGLESPDSPDSSPSTTGAPSGDKSGSDDDDGALPSPKESVTSIITMPNLSTSKASSSSTSLPSTSSSGPASTISSRQSVTSIPSSTSTLRSNSSPSFAPTPTSQGIGAISPPGAYPTSVLIVTSTILSSTTLPTSSASSTFIYSSKTQGFSGKVARPTQPLTATISLLPPSPPDFTGSPAEDNDSPIRKRPEHTLMSKGAEAAAVTLSIIGAIALVVGIILYCRRRRRRRDEKLEAELERDAANYAAIRASETAHVNNAIAPFAANGPHMTQSTNRSNTLFGPGSYARPETVSSTLDRSHIAMPQPTPNPFADPPLNKAYDVLAGRPRSTTLTDRGSWVKNPFKDPESERFDPFGELQAKARRERVKLVEIARREAELERQFEEKEKMGLIPPQRALDRKGSGVTLKGLGVLDRSDRGAYR
ncbi:uncharacterized protein EKO05_0000895 [Ascochyta rabiei]|uniref:Uncharacterized protein n=1 Tax=Didymella rabiei TaxID=5454 RepID=A0A163MIS1_DIDRA|nr:uncharacterized protein EKO05_0000895 [Ascochyta rabiei]KZM28756.1 hypothetical protein ST47_g107 [Ascochyta rabiei]UPX10226.1 hypothetical protein EKO05_0000895 [Ascochyta rabiei]